MATDLADPLTIVSIAQTAVLAVTMVIFIYQFRSQERAIKDASYQKALDDYTNMIGLLAQKPDLASLIDQLGQGSRASSGPKVEPLTPERAGVWGYMLLSYSLFERIYLLYEKKWIDEDTWSQWHKWLKVTAKHPIFQEVHRRSEGTFDKAFQKLVADAINSS